MASCLIVITNKLWNLILDAIEDKTELYSRGRRSGSSGVMRLTDKTIGNDVIFGLSHHPSCYLYISNPNAEISINLMNKLLERKDQIEKEFEGCELTWKPSVKRAQYIYLYYEDLKDKTQWTKLHVLPDEDGLDERDFNKVTKFFETYAPVFEKVMRKNILEIRN